MFLLDPLADFRWRRFFQFVKGLPHVFHGLLALLFGIVILRLDPDVPQYVLAFPLVPTGEVESPQTHVAFFRDHGELTRIQPLQGVRVEHRVNPPQIPGQAVEA
ncbi:hypothetical protein AKJ55_01995 [candidate division MSBL1 archaeon SCGC-AAA382M17]|uniref:Oligopeptide transport permease C-like N-terminal domain-containing protein n=1 Tax=candidate division MSBL1 archaeon SCGC-AAA382M17 TaxID=1698284 RepID=A0ABR5TIZ2_9EURY|nr:hypothetical protein AKJ55_01995 [candidate division MSBL1 archaeon SCGC-AAA382M17]